MDRFVFLDFDGCIDISNFHLTFDKVLKENVYMLCNEFLPEQQSRFVKCESRKGFDAERLSFAVGVM